MKPTALVTGGNSGIGFATAKYFKENGYDVTISGRDENRLVQAAQRLGVAYAVADMSCVKQITSFTTWFQDKPLNVLVNNAGIYNLSPLGEICVEDIAKSLNTNIRGPMLLTKNLLPALKNAKGCVVNISSAIVENGVPNSSLYATTKGAIEAFTRNLALELAPEGIRVNAVSPGSINTSLFNKFDIPMSDIATIREHIRSTIPLQRHGSPYEVAEVVYAMAISHYVTGSIWTVDGGISAC